MSGVVKEYVCLGHALHFESSEDSPTCPHGCTCVERVFLSAPSLGSNRTKNIDSTFRRIADKYKLGDMNNRDGKPARGLKPRQFEGQQEIIEQIRERFPTWGKVAPGATYNVATGQAEAVDGRSGSGVASAFGQYGGRGEGEDNLGKLKPQDLVFGVSPVPVKVHKDPQNLQISQARPEELTR